MSIRVLFLGEIVGKAGVFCIKNHLSKIKEEKNIDFVIAQAEGTTGGFGLGKNHSVYLHKLGIDVLTGGECIYYKKDMVGHIQKASYILRPANYPPGNPGRGWWIYRRENFSIAVIVLLGQAGFGRVHLSNPFTFLPELVSRAEEETKMIILDFHACTTAEKYTMFHHADGKLSAIIGTHGKTLTSDAAVFPGGTAVLCDAGRTGSIDSVGGLDPKVEIRKFITQIPERSKDAWGRLEMQGAVIEIDESGKAVSIESIRRSCGEMKGDTKNDGKSKSA